MGRGDDKDRERNKDKQPVPPGAPDRTPVKGPGKANPPQGDPKVPGEKAPRLAPIG